jgi:phage shock protein PspC (stress-responsive transcriptional regulator)
MKKKLTKSRTNIWLTGTLGGIAEYLGIDATIVRVAYIAISFALMGMPVLPYIVLAIIIPSSRTQKTDYGHNNPYYQANATRPNTARKDVTGSVKPTAKPDTKTDDDEWGDF